jgi:arylsulfatase A-like enzyme
MSRRRAVSPQGSGYRSRRERPNIILIVGDNQGCGAVGCYERCGTDFLTPNIDRLAAESARFDHAFCANA